MTAPDLAVAFRTGELAAERVAVISGVAEDLEDVANWIDRPETLDYAQRYYHWMRLGRPLSRRPSSPRGMPSEVGELVRVKVRERDEGERMARCA